ncbi:MAG: hypothetical protein ACK5KP_01130 [Paludibacteraceae bacterium]
MKKLRIILLVLSLSFLSSAQELKWDTGLDFFFDNTEFSRSRLAIDQTMTGVRLSQEIGWMFDENHSILGGISAQRSLATSDFTDKIDLMAYYQLKDENTLFKAGAFKRSNLLDDYSNFFFQDSIGYYKQTIEGLYLRKGDDRQFFKLWLDWTGLQSETERESFFIGASAYKEFGKLFFADFQSYMYHFATTRPNPNHLSVSDNLLGQLSVGVDYSNKRGLNKLKLSAGVLAGYERDRHFMDDFKTPIGLVIRADAEYRRFGIENLFYYGQKRMTLYEQYGNQLYWATPFLRSSDYLQNKLYWNAIDTKHVKGQLSMKTHVSEGSVYFEQVFTLNASINNDRPKVTRQPNIWERLFPRRSQSKDDIMM